MAEKFMETVLTPSVQDAQDHYYGRHQSVSYAPERDRLGPGEEEMIVTRDSFYMATVTESGWPYIQHRGGPAGFLKVLPGNRIGFADFKGNRQLLSTGNLSRNDRVALFLMDYPSQSRLKILGRSKVLDARDHPDLVEELALPDLRSRTERLFVIEVLSYDWNCPQYITPRFTADQVREAVEPLRNRIAELESQLEAKTRGAA